MRVAIFKHIYGQQFKFDHLFSNCFSSTFITVILHTDDFKNDPNVYSAQDYHELQYLPCPLYLFCFARACDG